MKVICWGVALVPGKSATIEVPRLPVYPNCAMTSARRTSAHWPEKGWPSWPGQTGPKQAMLIVASWVRPLTRPTNCWSGRIFEIGKGPDHAAPTPANRLEETTATAMTPWAKRGTTLARTPAAAFLVFKTDSLPRCQWPRRKASGIRTERNSQSRDMLPTRTLRLYVSNVKCLQRVQLASRRVGLRCWLLGSRREGPACPVDPVVVLPDPANPDLVGFVSDRPGRGRPGPGGTVGALRELWLGNLTSTDQVPRNPGSARVATSAAVRMKAAATAGAKGSIPCTRRSATITAVSMAI